MKKILWTYRAFIKYCVFSKIFKYFSDWFPLGGVSVCTQWQVKHKGCRRTCRVQKNHNILKKNTIFYEHPVVATVVVEQKLRPGTDSVKRL